MVEVDWKASIRAYKANPTKRMKICTINIPSKIFDFIDELEDAGWCINRTDFIRTAIWEKLERLHGMWHMMDEPIPEPHEPEIEVQYLKNADGTYTKVEIQKR